MYHRKDIPVVNKTLSISVQNEDMIVVNVEGELKTIFCEEAVLHNVLENVDGIHDFEAIENIFVPEYGKEAVKSFMNTLLSEKLIQIDEKKRKKTFNGNVCVIGNGSLQAGIETEIRKAIEEIQSIDIDEFLKISNQVEADIFFVILENATYAKVMEINRKLVQLEKSSIWVSFNGKAIILGPSVFPWKTPCLECHITQHMKTLEDRSEEEIEVNTIGKLQYAYEVNEQFSQTQMAYIAELLLQEALRLMEGNEKPNWFGTENYFYTNKMNSPIIKRYSPISSCRCCRGMNKNVISYEEYVKQEREISRSDDEIEDKIIYQTGGFRSATVEKTVSVLERALKKLPLKIEVEEAEENPFRGIIPSYHAHLRATYHGDLPCLFADINSQGKGLNRQQAYFSAAFELFERLSARYYGKKQLVIGSLEDVGTNAISFQGLENQIKNNIGRPIDWVEGKSLITGEKKLIPASMVFLSNAVFRGEFYDTSSSGLSAGATLEDAILQGLMEIIEHDAWIIGQANQIELPRIDIHTTENETLKKAICDIENMGYEIITRDYSNDMQISVFRTWIINHKDYFHYATNGFGASLSAEIALERSITEAVQATIPEQDIDIEHYGVEADYEAVYSYDSLYSLAYFVKKDMQNSPMQRKLSDYQKTDYTSVKEVLNSLIERMKKVLGEECDVLYVDLTREEIGIPTVRVIVTGDIQRVGEPLRNVSNRMFSFQRNMKYSSIEPKYEDLYMGPYPH